MIGIYKIENLVNRKIYIGQSVNIPQRWAEHKANLRNNKHENKHLQNAWNKYHEENFDFSVLEECSENELDEKECYYIDYYDSYNNGYNLTLGGGGTRKIHHVLQFDIEKNLIKKWDNGIIAATSLGINIGGVYSCIVHRINISGGYIWLYEDEYLADPNILDEHIKKIIINQRVLQYNFDGELINIFDNASDAKKKLGYSVANCCIHKCKSSHGFIFKYENDSLEVTKEYGKYVKNLLHNISNKPFYQVDINCKIVKEYNCQREAVEDGYSERLISECLRGLRESHKGYVWIYINDFNKLTKEECKHKINSNNRDNIKYYTVMQYDLEHNFIKEYPFVEHVKYNGFNPCLVANCCKGLKPQYKGYLWEYGSETKRAS